MDIQRIMIESPRSRRKNNEKRKTNALLLLSMIVTHLTGEREKTVLFLNKQQQRGREEGLL